MVTKNLITLQDVKNCVFYKNTLKGSIILFTQKFSECPFYLLKTYLLIKLEQEMSLERFFVKVEKI